MEKQKLIIGKLTDVFNEDNNLVIYFQEHRGDYNKLRIPITTENKKICDRVSEAFTKKSRVNLVALYKNNPHKITEFLLGLISLNFSYRGLLESYEYQGKLVIDNEFYEISVISTLGGLKYESHIRLENIN